jgi:hypothetical protein
MAVNTATLYANIEPVVRHRWGLERGKVKKQAQEIFSFSSSKDPIYETLEQAGPGMLKLKVQNQAIQTGTVTLGRPKRWEAATYAGGVELSYEAVRDAKSSEIKTPAGLLGRSTERAPQMLLAQFLDRSFDANFPATWDGKELCSTAHLRPDGTTYSNAMTVPASLSETSLEDVVIALRQTTGPDGLLDPVSLKKVVVASSSANLIAKIGRTERKLGSNYNDVNVVMDDAKKHVVFDYLTNQTRWFVTTDRNPDGLFWKWVEEPEFIRDNVSLTLSALFISFFRAMWGCEDPRSIYGVNAS